MTIFKSVDGTKIELNPDELQEYYARNATWDEEARDRLLHACKDYLKRHLNQRAQERDYDSATSCASYVNSTNLQWAAESVAFVAWRDNCYEYSYDYLAQAQSGQIPNPNIEDFISGLPVMEWPIT